MNRHVHIEDPYATRKKTKRNEDMKDFDILHWTCYEVLLCEDVLSASALLFAGNERGIADEHEEDLKKLNMVHIWRLDVK